MDAQSKVWLAQFKKMSMPELLKCADEYVDTLESYMEQGERATPQVEMISGLLDWLFMLIAERQANGE